MPDGADVNESPLRVHNTFRGTVEEFDFRADTTQLEYGDDSLLGRKHSQPMHSSQRKASFPEMDGPQWKPRGPEG